MLLHVRCGSFCSLFALRRSYDLDDGLCLLRRPGGHGPGAVHDRLDLSLSRRVVFSERQLHPLPHLQRQTAGQIGIGAAPPLDLHGTIVKHRPVVGLRVFRRSSGPTGARLRLLAGYRRIKDMLKPLFPICVQIGVLPHQLKALLSQFLLAVVPTGFQNIQLQFANRRALEYL